MTQGLISAYFSLLGQHLGEEQNAGKIGQWKANEPDIGALGSLN